MLTRLEQRVWKDTLYPEFPKAEYDARIHKVKEHMSRENLDILVLWDPNNIRYFSGFRSTHWQPMTLQCAVMLIPVDGEPIMIVPGFFLGVVEGFTFIKDIRLIHNPHVTRNLRELPALVAKTISELGYENGRVGIEGGEYGGMSVPRPINDIDLFRSSLERADLVFAADTIWKCRMIKSPAEIDALKIACQAVVLAYGDLVANFQLSWSEAKVASYLRHRCLEYAEDCPPPLCLSSSRRVLMPDVPAFEDAVTLSPGDRIALEPFPSYKGYIGSSARCFQVGPVPDEAAKKSASVDLALKTGMEAVKPGVTTGHILDVIKEVMRDEGIACPLDQGGHGVGLNFQEPPAIAEGEEYLLEENMVMALETWFISAGDLSAKEVPDVFGAEDYIVVTANGCYPLPTFRRDVLHLGNQS